MDKDIQELLNGINALQQVGQKLDGKLNSISSSIKSMTATLQKSVDAQKRLSTQMQIVLDALNGVTYEPRKIDDENA